MYEVRWALTPHCNFDCFYCRPGGEGTFNDTKPLNVGEIGQCGELLAENGYDSVRLTGGEPMMRQDLMEIIDRLDTVEGIDSISMVTNGSLLTEEKIKGLVDSALDSLTVSLDTLDGDRYQAMIRTRARWFEKVLQNIAKASQAGLNMRINVVVTHENASDLPQFHAFCEEHGVDLKLLDLNNNGMEDWNEQYVNFGAIRDLVRERSVGESVSNVRGGMGTPMTVFDMGNHNVIIKDSRSGTFYTEACRSCKHYPCQTGISSPIVTHDGHMKMCNLGEVSDFSLIDLVRYRRAFESFNDVFRSARFNSDWGMSDD